MLRMKAEEIFNFTIVKFGYPGGDILIKVVHSISNSLL